ncbi:Meak7 [Scenedesmus sp. PABB004]|nr:Meak7 [Scenedesmus sp. PABB004]
MLGRLRQALWPAPPKPPSVAAAEAAFAPDELAAIRREHAALSPAAPPGALDAARLLQWAGLAHAAPALREGLCAAVARLSGGDGSITVDGVVVAKARRGRAAAAQRGRAAPPRAGRARAPPPRRATQRQQARCERMGRAAAEDFGFDVLASAAAGGAGVPRAHVAAVVQGCLALALAGGAGDGAAAPPDLAGAAAAIAAGACSYDGGQGSDCMTRDGYAALCKASPALNAALTSLLHDIGASAGSSASERHEPAARAATPAGSAARLLEDERQRDAGAGASRHSSGGRGLGAAGPGPGSAALAAAAAGAAPRGPGRLQLPALGWGLASPAEGLLSPGWVWLLAPGLAPALRVEWRLLFSSARHGASYSTLLSRVAGAGATLLLVRDKRGALFGGLAHAPWAKAGAFYGDFASSIFSLLPAARLHPASGINANIQWCGAGFRELPNGLGFGGQVGHFGVWVDATMDTGMSRPTATYASPCLASAQTFEVGAVELWALAPPDEDDAPRGGGAAPGKRSKRQEREPPVVIDVQVVLDALVEVTTTPCAPALAWPEVWRRSLDQPRGGAGGGGDAEQPPGWGEAAEHTPCFWVVGSVPVEVPAAPLLVQPRPSAADGSLDSLAVVKLVDHASAGPLAYRGVGPPAPEVPWRLGWL